MDYGQLIVGGVLVAGLLGGGCQEQDGTRIDFEVEEPLFEPIDLDSGDVELAEGATVRARTSISSDYVVRASGRARGGGIDPIGGSGELIFRGQMSVDVEAHVDRPEGQADETLNLVDFEFEAELLTFNPFLLNEQVALIAGVPTEGTYREPMVGLPGAYVVFEFESPAMLPSFGGVCLRSEGGAVQYTARLDINFDFTYLISIEFDVPFVGTERLGTVGVRADLPRVTIEEFDLGTYDLDSGVQLEDVAPCG